MCKWLGQFSSNCKVISHSHTLSCVRWTLFTSPMCVHVHQILLVNFFFVLFVFKWGKLNRLRVLNLELEHTTRLTCWWWWKKPKCNNKKLQITKQNARVSGFNHKSPIMSICCFDSSTYACVCSLHETEQNKKKTAFRWIFIFCSKSQVDFDEFIRSYFAGAFVQVHRSQFDGISNYLLKCSLCESSGSNETQFPYSVAMFNGKQHTLQ